MATANLQNEAAQVILNTRDFCGSEIDAVRDFCADENIEFTTQFFFQARTIANDTWRDSQKAAGVKPKYWKH